MVMNVSALLLSLVTGMISGFMVSVPVGPINVTILNEGPHQGFRWGFLIGLGAVVMEVTYCGIAFAGFSNLFDSKLMRAAMELISVMLVFYLGVKYMLAHTLVATPPSAERLAARLHPHTAFMTGFVRVLCNPMVLLFWITLSATFVAHEWVEPNWTSKSVFLAGVAAGALAWFVMLSFIVTRGLRRFSAETLVQLSRLSGVMLVAVALVIGFRLIGLLAHR
jgi:threonine/homoserine/homoserine lactone efflux protein